MKILIIHDFDGQLELLDVPDSLISDDIEQFLWKQGYNVNNLTWFASSVECFPITYRKVEIDDLGNVTTTVEKDSLKMRSVYEKTQAIKSDELTALKQAVEKYGTRTTDGCQIQLAGELPIIIGNYDDSTIEFVVEMATMDNEGKLVLHGKDKAEGWTLLEMEADDFLSGQLNYVTEQIIQDYI